MAVCLFCRQALVGVIYPEHIIPESLGGWLPSYNVCNPCNHRFGHQVDIVVNDRLLSELRRESGLETHRAHALDPGDDDLRKHGPWYPAGDGSVKWSRDVYVDGDRVSIMTNTINEARRKIDQLNERRERRGEAPFRTVSEKIEVLGPRVHRSEPSNEEIANINSLFPREAAKIAIEYIAMVAGPNEALRSSLDQIRSFAQNGSPDIQINGVHLGESAYWLPRTRQLQIIARDEQELKHVQKLLDDIEMPDVEGWEPPRSFPRLINLYHELSVSWWGQCGWFRVVLFGWLLAAISLPLDVALPWGTYHRRGFLPRRITEGRR